MAAETYKDSRSVPMYQCLDGFILPTKVSPENFFSALKYKPLPNDVFIVTFPKCGTTWMQYIVANIYSNGKQIESASDYRSKCVFLEFEGAEAAMQMEKPGTIKTHLPFHMNPYSPVAKYIFVARNPNDCCVSLYHHTKNIPNYEFREGTFDDFFEIFVEGKTDFGDYFDTLMSWYQHRDDKNVLFLTYEDLKKDIQKEVLRIAEFLGSEYKEKLVTNPDLLSAVIKNSSFDVMKEVHLKEFENFQKSSSKKLEKVSVSGQLDKVKNPGRGGSNDKLRKGIVGDWRNYFCKSQRKRLEAKFLNRAKGTELPDLWKDYI